MTFQESQCTSDEKETTIEVQPINNADLEIDKEHEEGRPESKVNTTNLVGTWVEEKKDQAITMILSSNGAMKWKVNFGGKPHSNLSGTWRLNDNVLETRLSIVGRDDFRIETINEQILIPKGIGPVSYYNMSFEKVF